MSQEEYSENSKSTELELSQLELDSRIDEIREIGGVHIPSVLTIEQSAKLIFELESAQFTAIDQKYEVVREKSSIFEISLPSEQYPVIDWLSRQLVNQVGHQAPELGAWVPNEATVMRYESKDSGISPHRDMGYNYGLIAVFTLEGSATLSVLLDESDIKGDRDTFHPLRRFRAGPGSLTLLRGDNFPGTDEQPALHAITAPEEGTRTSVSFRMLSE